MTPRKKTAPKKAEQPEQPQQTGIAMNQIDRALFGALGVIQGQLAAQAVTLERIEKLLTEK